LQETSVDHQAYLDEFEDAEFEVLDYIGEFTGYKTFDLSLFDALDYVDLDEENCEPFKAKFNVTYDVQSNIVTLCVEMPDESGEVLIDTIYGLAFQNANGDIDAYLDIDGEIVLLSELATNGLIDNTGWLKNLITFGALAIIAVPIAIVAAPLVISVVSVTVLAIATAEIVTGVANYNHNKRLADPGALINDQNTGYWHNWKFGWNTMYHNGCALIAVYNVMILRENPQKMADIVRFYEVTGGQLMFGLFGTDPTHLPQYLNSKSVKTVVYNSLDLLQSAANKMLSTQQILLTYWNPGGIFKGAHTIAVSKSGSIYTSYNNASDNSAHKYASLSDIIPGAFMMGYIVG
jgi:hypothetical protein